MEEPRVSDTDEMSFVAPVVDETPKEDISPVAESAPVVGDQPELVQNGLDDIADDGAVPEADGEPVPVVENAGEPEVATIPESGTEDDLSQTSDNEDSVSEAVVTEPESETTPEPEKTIDETDGQAEQYDTPEPPPAAAPRQTAKQARGLDRKRNTEKMPYRCRKCRHVWLALVSSVGNCPVCGHDGVEPR